MFGKLIIIVCLYKVNSLRNPCENIMELVRIKSTEQSCWDNIFERVSDNSLYKYENVCITAFEKHLCQMMKYQKKHHTKNWCNQEYKQSYDNYRNKCSKGIFSPVEETPETLLELSEMPTNIKILIVITNILIIILIIILQIINGT